MKLNKIKWRNLGCYGNKLQELTLDPKGALWIISGSNGSGKCHSKDTKLTVSIDNQNVMKEFLSFLKE